MLKIFGDRLKTARKEHRFTQAEIAKILFVSKTTVCQWEKHKQEPSLEAIVKLCEIFNVNSDYLLGLEDEFGNKIIQ